MPRPLLRLALEPPGELAQRLEVADVPVGQRQARDRDAPQIAEPGHLGGVPLGEQVERQERPPKTARHVRGHPLPEEWEYRPGMQPVDHDDDNAPLVASATTEALMCFMEDIEDDVKRLKAEGKATEPTNLCQQLLAGVRASGASRSRRTTR